MSKLIPSIKFLESAFLRIDDSHRSDLLRRQSALGLEICRMDFDSSATAREHVAAARVGFKQAVSRILEMLETAFVGEQEPTAGGMPEMETTGAITVSRTEDGCYVIDDAHGRHMYETHFNAVGYVADRLEQQTKRIQDFKANPSLYSVCRAIDMRL